VHPAEAPRDITESAVQVEHYIAKMDRQEFGRNERAAGAAARRTKRAWRKLCTTDKEPTMNRAWWKEAVVYQIYPRSFMDSNGDGIGDLRGIISKLDYLQMLGVDVVWLSPVYRSPNDDNGYDISDYQEIAPEFGTLEDWDELAAGLHARGMRIVMDLVVNHTSDEHPWFQDARSSRSSRYRDFYIWREGKDGREPNNWASIFGGSAWEFNSATGDYYLHLFSKKQPDLNWDNSKLQCAVYDMMHWWLKRGVDGFRMDTINLISKVQGLPDAPNPDGRRYVSAPQYFANGPRLLEFLGEMKREVLSKYDIMTVGETPFALTSDAVKLVHAESGYLHMLISFEHVDLDLERKSFATKWHRVPFDPGRLKTVMHRWQAAMDGIGWNCLYFNNHDQPRAVSRFGDDGTFRRESATMLATVLHMHQGTPFVYQGEEIDAIEDYRDLESLNGYRELTEDQGFSPEEALRKVQFRSRDNGRTPMQWTAGPNAGFSIGIPWIKVNPNHTSINVEAELADPCSVLHYYRRLIRLRRELPVVVYGRYELVEDTDPAIYAFTRTLGSKRLLIVANFTSENRLLALPPLRDGAAVAIGNYEQPGQRIAETTHLRAYEARVYRLT
jgi:oligo-1,6-glucosidase